MYNKLIFFNHGHLGDTILSIPFINEVKKCIKAESYAISNNYDYSYISDVVDEHIPLSTLPINPNIWVAEYGNNLYFNTWYGLLIQPDSLKNANIDISNLHNLKYADGILYNWENYLFWFNQTLKIYNPSLSIEHMSNNKLSYIKSLKEFDLSHIPLINDSRKKILIFNQIATSGQADNEDFSTYIDDISKTKNIVIYTSQKTPFTRDNVVNLNNYISYPDLDVIAYLSKYCDIICGPGNAPIINTWAKDNLENNKKTYITINRNNAGEAIWFKETFCKNVVVNSTNELFNELYKII